MCYKHTFAQFYAIDLHLKHTTIHQDGQPREKRATAPIPAEAQAGVDYGLSLPHHVFNYSGTIYFLQSSDVKVTQLGQLHHR